MGWAPERCWLGAEVGEEVPAAGRWLPACQQLLSGLPLARTGWAAFA